MTSFPFFRQVDLMDCGPACLQMMAKYYGKDYSLATLSDLTGMDGTGATLLGLTEAAESMGFKTLSVKTTLRQIEEYKTLPCIAHWKQIHFIVIYKVKHNTVFVADPLKGLLEYAAEEFTEMWAVPGDQDARGIILLLEPDDTPTTGK